MNEAFRHMHVPLELGTAFLDTFSRMEYALKSSGDFADGDADGIDPAWDRFANSINDAFCAIKHKEFQAAIAFLLIEPARKQIHTGFGPLVLDANQTQAQRTLLVVRTVRNNVIHGGKIQPEGEKEKGRNEKLVASSLTVLRHAADLNEKVRAKYHAWIG